MKQIKFEEFEFNEKTMRFDKRTYMKEYPDEAVREYDWCTVCGWSKYPECTKTCKDYPGRKNN